MEKTFDEIQEYFNSLTIEQLNQYHDELLNIRVGYNLIKQICKDLFEDDSNIWLYINKLHWHYSKALLKKLNETRTNTTTN